MVSHTDHRVPDRGGPWVYLLVLVCLTGGLAGLAQPAAAAGVTIHDWRGASVTVEEGAVDSDGVRIVFHTVGEGPLVVFVHSITGPWFDFRHQIVALSANHRVVSMSTRGTDQSDKPTGVEAYASARIADDIAAVIDHFGEERAIIVGQDSGGLHAWHFAMTHPERTAALISLGSVHPAGLIRELATNPEQQQASQFQRNMQENPSAGTQFGERMRSAPPRPDDSPELGRLRTAAYARLDPQSIVNFSLANWPRSPVTLDSEGFGFTIDTFPPVQAPTLLIYGKDSGPFLNATLDGMWQWVEGDLTMRVLPGVGHGPHTEAPGLVTPLMLEWLEARDR
jgi:pimeloyl-ACP methyl ester carboxylesterase